MSKVVKSTLWVITSINTVRSKVSFEEPVTAEEAEELFHNGEYQDIIDEETLSVSSPEAWTD